MQGLIENLASITTSIAFTMGISPQALSSSLAIALCALGALAVTSLLTRSSAGKAKDTAHVILLIVCFSLCSSMLLILNKVAITHVPTPSFLLFLQLASCSVFIKGMALGKWVDAEELEWGKAKEFLLVVLGFIGTLYSNMTVLKYAPVDTLICFRAAMPLLIATIEYFYLGRELPSARSWGSLVGVFTGVALYTMHDINFNIIGYIWIAIWFSFATFETVYVKKVVDSISMTTWTRSYYQNTLAVLPMLALAWSTGEVEVLMNTEVNRMGVFTIILSCIGGLGMSYFAFALRAVISATSFSVIGNLCKMLTILVNVLMWDNHSNAAGTIALIFCLLTGGLYQQAPMRQKEIGYLPITATEKAVKHGNAEDL